MEKFVTTTAHRPLSLTKYRQRVADIAQHTGDLWVSDYPLSDPLFPKLSGEAYAGCGALWRAANMSIPNSKAQSQFNLLWKDKVKMRKPKDRARAAADLRFTLVQDLQNVWNREGKELVAQLDATVLAAEQEAEGMEPGTTLNAHLALLKVFHAVRTAFQRVQANERSTTVLENLFVRMGKMEGKPSSRTTLVPE